MNYEWYKNVEPSGTGESFEGQFKRSDKISVRIIPFDREDYGRPITISTEIFNSPPRILMDGIEKFQNNIYTYQIKASDPDGDKLTYSLMQAPENMTIDETGLVIWKVDDKNTGRYPITVQITDGHGGKIQYSFDVVIRAY
ncbi:MAG: Ig domain-containing protein [Thermodesulfovibrionales bacterium]